MAAALLLAACDATATPADRAPVRAARPAQALPDSVFAALHARISEPGGYFDTDNLISNESGYLNVMGALEALAPVGGAYVGVGPGQNFSYIGAVRPRLAFIVDIRRDNVLHHLLLKALMERAPTRLEYLAGLHGRAPPSDPGAWADAGIDEIMGWIDGSEVDPRGVAALHTDVAQRVSSYGIPLSEEDLATIRRFHQVFIDAGPGLRFNTHGRPPRPYYPTYRQLVLETNLEGERASFLADPADYAFVREMQLANRIVPVVGDLAGDHAVREMGEVLRERGLELSAFYVSNVEFYLWRGRTFQAWVGNVASLPAAEGALVIRSYFPNFGGPHPSSVPGYYATQILQPVASLASGGFRTYVELVTRDAVDLAAPTGRR